MTASDDMTLSSNSNISSFAKAIPFYKNNIVLLTFFIATLYKLLLLLSYRSTDLKSIVIGYNNIFQALHIWYGTVNRSDIGLPTILCVF